MLRVLACVLTGAACLLGSVIATHRPGKDAGMAEQPEIPTALDSSPAPAPAQAGGDRHWRPRGPAPVQMGGQVRHPGLLPFTPGLTLKAAIEQAGGLSDFGTFARVALTRRGSITVHDLRQPGEAAIPLQAGDRIAPDQQCAGIFGARPPSEY